MPDAWTIWAFKEQLVKKNIFGLLFEDFDKFLREKKLILNQGVIIDGSFVEVPRQRNSREAFANLFVSFNKISLLRNIVFQTVENHPLITA